MQGEVRVVDDVPQSFAALIATEAPSSLALSGGDTARCCYELLATVDVDWRGVAIFFGDERWVPVHDPDSNEGMARVTFLDEVAPRVIHSAYRATESIEQAAERYDQLLRAAGEIEVVHLGLGVDGHTASLFPGSDALDEDRRLVVATRDDLHPHHRLTFTFPAIARAHLVVVTVVGAAKHDALDAVRRGEPVPASRISAERVVWLVDPGAAGRA
jgi:6-phosphogluconolactonase